MNKQLPADFMEQYQFGFNDPENYVFKEKKGLDAEVVRNISRMKNEPDWMLEFRLKALEHFLQRPIPVWGVDLKVLNERFSEQVLAHLHKEIQFKLEEGILIIEKSHMKIPEKHWFMADGIASDLFMVN